MSNIIIIGGGHNGLVCGGYLAQAGHAVTVVEKANTVGGCTITESLHPGFLINTGALELEGIVHSGVCEDLQLEQHGLEWIFRDHLLSAWVGDQAIHLPRNVEAASAIIEKNWGSNAGASWKAYAQFSGALMDLVGTFQHVNAPDASSMGGLFSASMLGEKNEALIQTALQPASIVIQHWLDEPILRGAAMAYATHPQVPPWIPGTGVLGCLLGSSHGGQGARPKGGTGQLIDALVKSFEASGGAVRCGAGVSGIHIQAGRVQAVELEDGEVLKADLIVSTIDIKRLSKLIADTDQTDVLRDAAKKAHTGLYNVGEVKVDLALSKPPEFKGEQSDYLGSLRYLMTSSEHYEEHFRQINAGLLPQYLPMMAAVPSQDDPSMAPEGQATLWLSSFVPAKLAQGLSWPDANEIAAERMLQTLERFAPGVADTIIAKKVTGPADWEARTGNPAGNPNHLDMTLDQLFGYRPGVGLNRYQSSVQGLYLSGAGTHPGGGVHGMPGKLAAQRILNDLSGKKTSTKPSLWSLFKTYLQLRKSMH